MRKIILFMHTSLDGFVCGPKGEMNWIHADEEIFESAGKATSEADSALYGRVTYEMMEAYWPAAGDAPNASKHDKDHSKWYNNVEKIVMSKTLKESDLSNTKVLSGNIPEQIQELKEKSGKNILIFGSPSASHFLMEHDLIDEYRIFQNPILIGEGVSMFRNINKRIKLKLTDFHVYTSGVVELHYIKK